MPPRGENAPISATSTRRASRIDSQDKHLSPPGQKGDVRSPSPTPLRRIKTVQDFHAIYELGDEVMPSTHSYMKVHFAVNRKTGRESVVKVRFKPECFRSRTDEKNWRRNTEFFMNMPDSCGVAALYDVIEDSKGFYIVMEKVEGQDLFETMEAEGGFSMSSSREIVRQLLVAVAHLHRNRSVHKDLKLENVMLATSRGKTSADALTAGAVKVIDFDTCEEWTPHEAKASKDVVGTDQYIAQEAYAGKYSPLSDVFSVGVVAYRLLCGRFPYHDEIFDDEAGENWVGSPKMAQIRRRLKLAKVDFDHRVFKEHPQAADITARMLAYDERGRPTAAVALEHPWFQDEASSSAPKLFPASAKAKRASQSGASFKGRPVVVRPCLEDFLDDGIIIAEESGAGRR